MGWFLLALLLVSCQSAPEPAPGTLRMAERLARLARGADPAANTYLSRQRVAWMRAQPVPEEPVSRLSFHIRLAKELLQAGHSEEAIALFEEAVAQAPALHVRTRPSLKSLLALSYLRLGEQENCIAAHNTASCLLPIGSAGVHSHQRGARGAARLFAEVLAEEPGDLSARWLLNIAYMALGEYPRSVPDQWLIPPSAFASDYDIGPFVDAAPSLGLAAIGLAGGGIAEDFDNDGFVDIVASSWDLEDPLRFFRNQGDGTFEERSRQAGLEGITGGLNLRQADYDNDGDFDVLVLRGAWFGGEGEHPNSLLRNEGGGFFADVTEEAGLLSFHPTQTAAWADFDLDGDLDLFIGNESVRARFSPFVGAENTSAAHPCELFLNQGDGTFREVAAAAGAAVEGFVKAVTWGDYDNDGFPDLYISRLREPNILLHNEGVSSDGIPRFAERTREAGVAEPLYSFPAWFFDYDNDGWEDLFVSGYRADAGDIAAEYLGLEHGAERPHLYRNLGDGTFQDVAQSARLDRILYTMGCNYGDLDNDGWLDFYAGTGDPDLRLVVPNRMFRNAGDGTFQDVSTSGGFGHLQKGHGVSFADMDNDGDQDVHVVMGGAYSGDVAANVLFLNPGHGNHWIALDLQGVRSNRSGAGARIQVDLRTPEGRRSLHRRVDPGASFGASPLRQHIGLGRALGIERLKVTWPASGRVQIFEQVGMDRLFGVREDSDQLKEIPLRTIALSTGGSDHAHH